MYSLPSAINARDLINYTPAVTRVSNIYNPFADVLKTLNRPISRLQNLYFTSGTQLYESIQQLNPVCSDLINLSSTIASSYEDIELLCTSLRASSSISQTIKNTVSDIYASILTFKRGTVEVLNQIGLVLGDNTVGICINTINFCNILALLKADISSLIGQILQLERSYYAKLNKSYSSSVAPKLKSIMKDFDCRPMLAQTVSYIRTLSNVYGLNLVLDLDNVQTLRKSSNLGSISDVAYELNNIFTKKLEDFTNVKMYDSTMDDILHDEKLSESYSEYIDSGTSSGNLQSRLTVVSLYEQTEANKELSIQDIDYTSDDVQTRLDNAQEKLYSEAAKDVLDITVEKAIDALCDTMSSFNEVYNEALLSKLVSDTNNSRLKELSGELSRLNTYTQEISTMPDKVYSTISDNVDIVCNVLDTIKSSVSDTMSLQKEDITRIYNNLLNNALLVDQSVVTTAQVDTSCKMNKLFSI